MRHERACLATLRYNSYGCFADLSIKCMWTDYRETVKREQTTLKGSQ